MCTMFANLDILSTWCPQTVRSLINVVSPNGSLSYQRGVPKRFPLLSTWCPQTVRSLINVVSPNGLPSDQYLYDKIWLVVILLIVHVYS